MKKIVFSLIFISTFANCAEHEIQMLSWGNGEPMVFNPPVLKIEAGDTVTFIPTQQGHQVDSIVVPEGAEKMHSEIDEKYSVTLNKEGIYFYTCLPHRTMNMSGLIQIGEPKNRNAVVTAIGDIESRVVMNKDRLQKYLKTLDDMNAKSKSDNTKEKGDAKNSTEKVSDKMNVKPKHDANKQTKCTSNNTDRSKTKDNKDK